MSQDPIYELLNREILANLELEALLDHLLRGGNTSEALNACKRAEHSEPTANAGAVSAMDYSRRMHEALREEEFRWLDLTDSLYQVKARRRERILIYRRLKSLFEREIAITRRQKRASMALGSDWSSLPQYLRESLTIARYQVMLNLAGWLFAAGIPGAPDICDAAVFGIVRAVYLPAA